MYVFNLNFLGWYQQLMVCLWQELYTLHLNWGNINSRLRLGKISTIVRFNIFSKNEEILTRRSNHLHSTFEFRDVFKSHVGDLATKSSAKAFVPLHSP